jgi:galactonate dehydratase
MKITAIDTLLVSFGNRNVPFVQVRTDEGITGLGEAYSCGPDKATVEAIRDFALWLEGRDPRDIEALYHLMFAGSRFPGGSVVGAAISGIEHALWDIAGKAAGLPVYRLLGGRCRDRVRVYQNPGGRTPEEMAEKALQAIDRYGYTALKLSPLPPDYASLPWAKVVAESVRRCEAVRRAVGDDIDIGLDPHAKVFEPALAIELAEALKPMRPFFIEEPLRPENRAALAKVREHVSVPIATGEMLYTRYEFRELLALQAVDIIQPDVCITGGLLEMKKIASMAEASYVTVAPHNPCGPVATAVNTHFAASTSNFVILEYIPDDAGVRREVVKEPVRLVNGYLEIPEAPGLGVEIDEKAAARHPFQPWRRPFNTRVDGSLAWQ